MLFLNSDHTTGDEESRLTHLTSGLCSKAREQWQNNSQAEHLSLYFSLPIWNKRVLVKGKKHETLWAIAPENDRLWHLLYDT